MRRNRHKKYFEHDWRNKPTRHHLLPSSRGGKDHPDNIMIVVGWRHALWHQVWGNDTPEEIIRKVIALQQLFGDRAKLDDILTTIIQEWCPKHLTFKEKL